MAHIYYKLDYVDFSSAHILIANKKDVEKEHLFILAKFNILKSINTNSQWHKSNVKCMNLAMNFF